MVWWNISRATISHVFQLRINGECVTNMLRIWCMNGDATVHDVAYDNLNIAYPRRKWRMHGVETQVRAAINSILRRMVVVCTAHGLRTHAEPLNTPHSILVVTLANVWAVDVRLKCPVEYLNVQFNLANLISHVNHRNDIILITVVMIGYL